MTYQDTYVYGKLVYDETQGAGVQNVTCYVIIKFSGITGVGSVKISATQLNDFTNYTTGHTNLAAYNTATLDKLCANVADNSNDGGTLELWQIITSANDVVAANSTGTTHFQNVNFAGVNFTNCLFNAGASAANLAAVKTNFTNCSFDGATLPCQVRYSTFDMCNMNRAILTRATLIGTDFTKSTGMALLGGDNDNNNVKTITLANDGGTPLVGASTGILLPAFCGVTANANGVDPDTLTITLPGTAVTVDSSLASGALTAVASPSASIPSGPIVINTSTTIITNANVGGNIGRLIPLNVLKLARAVNCVLHIQ